MKLIMNAFMQPIAHSAMAKRNVHFEDGLYAGLCGTGSPMPDINRAGCALPYWRESISLLWMRGRAAPRTFY